MTQKMNCYLCDLCREVIGYGQGPDGPHVCETCKQAAQEGVKDE